MFNMNQGMNGKNSPLSGLLGNQRPSQQNVSFQPKDPNFFPPRPELKDYMKNMGASTNQDRKY